MNQWSIFKILASFVLLVQLAVAANPGTVLDLKNHGAVCGFVKYNPKSKKEAAVSLYIKSIAGTDESKFNDLKIPTLIFRYLHIANFSNIPPIQKFDNEYRARFDKDAPKLPIADNKFELKLENGYTSIDEQKLYNDYVTPENNDGSDSKHVDVIFPVKEDGYYCVYIAPPTDIGLTDIQIPVKFSNSYGYLPYLRYVVYSQLKYGIIIALGLAALLLHAILKYRVGDDFKNLNNVSLISKAVIFYILVPRIMLWIFTSISEGLTNLFSPSDSPSRLLSLINLVDQWAIQTLNIFESYCLLLFVMGYGVMYYQKGSSRNYRKFPTKLSKLTTRLLFGHVLVVTISLIYSEITASFDVVSGDVSGAEIVDNAPPRTIAFVLAGISGAFAFVWFALTFVFYFKTKKTIASFAPVTTNAAEDATIANSKIVHSFRRSILIIFLIPLILAVSMGIIAGYRLSGSIEKLGFTPGVERVPNSYMFFETQEWLYSNSCMLLLMFWAASGSELLTILGIYLIWIKDNNGLAVDEKDYDGIADFEISDEES